MSKININTEDYWEVRYGAGNIVPEKLVSGVHENLYKKLVDSVFNLKNKKILDLGSGTSPVSFLLKKRNFDFTDKEYVCIDFSENGLKIAKSRCPEIVAYKSRIDGVIKISGLKENYFDIVLCSEVLEHITDYNSVLDNIYKYLSESGTAIVSVPFGRIMIKEHYHMNLPIPVMEVAHQKSKLDVYGIIKIDRWSIFKSRKLVDGKIIKNDNDLTI